MTVETEAQLEGLRVAARIVSGCLRHMAARLEPGMTTAELDALGAAYLAIEGARPAPALTYGFPGTTCISVNHDLAHGVPGPQRLRAGDLVNIDVSAEKDGYFADTGGSFTVGPGGTLQRALCYATRQALTSAVRTVRAGAPLGGIGRAIGRVARARRFTAVRNLGSHGVGAALHEAPAFIPGYPEPRERRRLHAGQVITIEPFLTTGPAEVSEGGDGWTLSIPPGHHGAQYEHTLVVTARGAEVLTEPPWAAA